MKAKSLREKTPDDLKKELFELLREQFNLRMQKGLGGRQKPHYYKKVRCSIARIKTLLREKEVKA